MTDVPTRSAASLPRPTTPASPARRCTQARQVLGLPEHSGTSAGPVPHERVPAFRPLLQRTAVLTARHGKVNRLETRPVRDELERHMQELDGGQDFVRLDLDGRGGPYLHVRVCSHGWHVEYTNCTTGEVTSACVPVGSSLRTLATLMGGTCTERALQLAA